MFIFYVGSLFGGVRATNSFCTNMYERTFPIKVMQSPTHGAMSSRLHRNRPHCTAQEVRAQEIRHSVILSDSFDPFGNDTVLLFCYQSVREEEKEIYRQLLTMVSGGQSSFHHNGSSHTIVRSHRDL